VMGNFILQKKSTLAAPEETSKDLTNYAK